MKKIFVTILLAATLVGCKQHTDTDIADSILSASCQHALEKMHATGDIQVEIAITSQDFLCSSTSDASREYKVICNYNLILQDTTVEGIPAMITLVFDNNTNELLSEEVRLNA